jgi:GTP-binding protein HflX
LQERAILVGVSLKNDQTWLIEERLNELERLALTAGAQIVEKVTQLRDKPHSRTYIGPGKAREIANIAEALKANLVIFDVNLSPSQQYNLEQIIPVKIIDRTALILDIFAQHAHSSEGKLQVELAQLSYLLPRLTGMGTKLSRLGGGIGTRGPGETKLEVDRRRIRKRIRYLQKQLEKLVKNREIQRGKRRKSDVFNVALVGYTNSGKSTLLNSLTKANVLVEDKLFATLDSTSRKLSRSKFGQVVISDTVGFIRNLPHQLVAAFRSTLDEVRYADLLLHIVDITQTEFSEQIDAVNKILQEIGADSKPQILVFNKIDIADSTSLNRVYHLHRDALFISAQKKIGLDRLIEAIKEVYYRQKRAKKSAELVFVNRSLQSEKAV